MSDSIGIKYESNMLFDLLPEIANNINLVYNIKTEDLSSISRKSPLPEARKMFTLVSYKLGQSKNLSIYLKRHRTTIKFYNKSANFYLKYYSDFQEKYEKLILLNNKLLEI